MQIPEFTKDKYIALALVAVLLGSYVVTRDGIIGQLLPIAVGGVLALLRSSATAPPPEPPPQDPPTQ